ncbi:MAG: PQQ-dependent sugar dehydrogenase [Wenzhouxiangellaceae bacterium]
MINRRLTLLALLMLSTGALIAQIPPDVTLDPVPGISGLSGPLGIKHAPDGSGRLFIVEQGGRVRIINSSGTLLATPFVDLGNQTTASGERGLLDIAFHPLFASNGKFYLHYSAGTTRPPGTRLGDTIVAEFSVTGNPDVANNTPDRIILTVSQDFSNHNGGQMRFGPDGYLYLGLGDGGSGNDPCDRAQTIDPADIVAPSSCGSGAPMNESLALLGKMLRIDVDQTTPAGTNNLCGANADGSANYAIPPANPYFGQSNRCGEILLYGLRNPWRWSFDRQTQDLWIGDVGQNVWEEVDLLPWPLAGGDNLGWKPCEGSWQRGSSTTPCNLPGSVLPVLEYNHNGGHCSITGGYRYRGPVISLQGRYIYTDFCSGTIWFARPQGTGWVAEVFGPAGGSVRSFGEDQDGHLYVIVSSSLYRFNGIESDLLFADGFESSP